MRKCVEEEEVSEVEEEWPSLGPRLDVEKRKRVSRVE